MKDKAKAQDNSKSKFKSRMIGTFCIIASFAMLLGLLYPLAFDKKVAGWIYLVVFLGVEVLAVAAYWIYISLYDRRQRLMADPKFYAAYQEKKAKKFLKQTRRKGKK